MPINFHCCSLSFGRDSIIVAHISFSEQLDRTITLQQELDSHKQRTFPGSHNNKYHDPKWQSNSSSFPMLWHCMMSGEKSSSTTGNLVLHPSTKTKQKANGTRYAILICRLRWWKVFWKNRMPLQGSMFLCWFFILFFLVFSNIIFTGKKMVYRS